MKFKLRLRERMTSNLDEGFAKIWSEERSKLLESLKDQPELTNQVLLEMKDSRSFRVAAQRARGKQTPPIPRDHQAMDPEKVQHKLELFVLLVLFIGTPIIYFRLVWENLFWVGGRIQRPKTKTLLLLGHLPQ